MFQLTGQYQWVIFYLGSRPEHDVVADKKKVEGFHLVPWKSDHSPDFSDSRDKMSGPCATVLLLCLPKTTNALC